MTNMQQWEASIQEVIDNKDNIREANVNLAKLSEIPDGLAGDLDVEKKKLFEEIRSMQVHERSQREDEAWQLYNDATVSIAEKQNTLKDALEEFLYFDDEEANIELQDKYALLSNDQLWTTEKVEQHIGYLQYQLSAGIKQLDEDSTLTWLRDERTRIDTAKPFIKDASLSENLNEIREEIDREYQQLLEFKELKDSLGRLHNDYVPIIYTLDQRVNDDMGETFTEAMGGSVQGTVIEVRNILREQYTIFSLDTAMRKLTDVTGLSLDQWVSGERKIKGHMSISELKTELRKGKLNLNPALKLEDEYASIPFQYVPDSNTKIPPGEYPVTPRAIYILIKSARRSDFKPTSDALDEAMLLIEDYEGQWNDVDNRSLEKLYKIKSVYPNTDFERWVKHEEENEYEILNSQRTVLLQKPLYSLNQEEIESSYKLFRDTPLGLDIAPADRRDFVDNTRREIQLKRTEWETFNSNLQRIIDTTEAAEDILEASEIDIPALGRYVEEFNRLIDVREHISPRLEERIKTIEKEYTARLGSKKIFKEVDKQYKVALASNDIASYWSNVVNIAEGKYGSDDVDTTDPELWEKGRRIYLESHAKMLFLEALDLPYYKAGTAEGETRKDKLEIALTDVKALRRRDPRRDGLDNLEKVIGDDLLTTNQHLEESAEVRQLEEQVKLHYENLDFIDQKFDLAYGEIKDKGDAYISLQTGVLDRWKEAVESEIDSVSSSSEPLPRDHVDKIRDSVNHLNELGRRISGTHQRKYSKWIDNALLSKYHDAHERNDNRDGNLFALPLSYSDYNDWHNILTDQRNPNMLEVKEVKTLRAVASCHEEGNNAEERIQSLHKLCEQALAEDLFVPIVYDALLHGIQKNILTAMRTGGYDDKDQVDAEFENMRGNNEQLLRFGETEIIGELAFLWGLRIQSLQSTLRVNPNLGGSYSTQFDTSASQAFSDLEDILRRIADHPFENHKQDAVGWMAYRQAEMKMFVQRMRQLNTSAIRNELQDNVNKSIRPNDLARFLEYAFVLAEQSSTADTSVVNRMINTIIPSLTQVHGYLQQRVIEIVKQDFPSSINEATLKMQSLNTQIKAIQTGLSDKSGLIQNIDSEEREQFKTLGDSVNTIASKMNEVRKNYDKARQSLAQVIRADAANTTATNWNPVSLNAAIDHANSLIHETLTLASDITVDNKVEPDISLEEITTFESTWHAVSEQMKEIITHRDTINEAITGSGQFRKEKNAVVRYQDALSRLDKIRDSRRAVDREIAKLPAAVFYNNVPELQIPDKFMRTPINMMVEGHGLVQMITGLEQHIEIVTTLLNNAKHWIQWVDDINETYAEQTAKWNALKTWFEHLRGLNKAVFEISNPNDLPDQEDFDAVAWKLQDYELTQYTATEFDYLGDELASFDKLTQKLLALTDNNSGLPAREPSTDVSDYFDAELEDILDRAGAREALELCEYLHKEASIYDENIDYISITYTHYNKYVKHLDELIEGENLALNNINGGFSKIFGFGGNNNEQRQQHLYRISDYEYQQQVLKGRLETND